MNETDESVIYMSELNGDTVTGLAKEIYTIGYEDGVQANKVCRDISWEERIDAIKDEISELSDIKWVDKKTQEYTNWQGMKKKVLAIIDKHCGGDMK